MPTFGYWKIRGLAQPCRLLLNYVGEEFEDVQYVNGPAPKYESEWFDVKYTLGLDFPNLPYYIDGEHKLTQTHAILRYIARKHNLLGITEEEKIRVDVMLEQTMDLRNAFVALVYSSDFDKLRPDYVAELPPKIKAFDKFIGERNFFAGPNVTVADFHIYEMIDQHMTLVPNLLDDCPNLKAFQARFEALPAIKKYMASDKFMKKPLNSPMASFGMERE